MKRELMNNVILTPDQRDAEELIAEWFLNRNEQIFVLCGYAGTGKTFLLNRVVKNLGLEAGESAVFVAPTGKAASVLIQGGTPASTLHSLIYTREEDIEINEDGEVISERFLRFVKKERIAAEIRLIIVDETSMVSDDILCDLLSFGVKCLFAGDPAQLPPVGGSNSLLKTPCITLKTVVRQEAGNPIVRLAERVRRGERLEYGTYGENVAVMPRYEFTREMREEVFPQADIIIAGRNYTRNAVNREVRAMLGIAEGTKLPIAGEKVICTLNQWARPLDKDGNFHLVNGIVGKCYNVREGEDGLGVFDFQPDFLNEKSYDIPFDAGIFTEGRFYHGYGDKACFLESGTVVHEDNYAVLKRVKVKREEVISRFEFAYAVTCHKAQGSEYDFVVVIDESRYFERPWEWLYTAITRAKKKLLIVR